MTNFPQWEYPILDVNTPTDTTKCQNNKIRAKLVGSTIILLIFITEYFHHAQTSDEQQGEQEVILPYSLTVSQNQFQRLPNERWDTPIKCPATIRERLGGQQQQIPPANGHWYLTGPKDCQHIPLPSPAVDALDADWNVHGNGHTD